MAPPSENRRALRSHPCVALSSRYPGKAITGYTIFHDWTIVENSIVLDMGSTLVTWETDSRYVSDNQRLCTRENLPDFRKVR